MVPSRGEEVKERKREKNRGRKGEREGGRERGVGGERKERKRENYIISNILPSCRNHTVSCLPHSLNIFIKDKLLKSAPMQEKENYLLRGGVSKNLQICFKNHHLSCNRSIDKIF